jgi:cytochrome c oxidase assembly protein subunit 15
MNIKPLLRLRAALTAAFVLGVFVVFAGATVRATGSGMGCPDWPLCYGCWIPPVSVSQLPADYAQKYAVGGRPAEFDAVKTWIEYVNRLSGAAVSAGVLVSLVLTVPALRSRPSLGVLTALSAVVLALVAWLGAKVVDSYLAAHAVTAHLLTAYALLLLLLAQKEIVERAIRGPRPRARLALAAALAAVGVAFVGQWLLGIRTREEVEAWLWNQDLARSVWEAWGGAYDLHKLAGVAVGLSAAALAWLGWRTRTTDPRAWKLALTCAGLVAAQAAVGVVLWVGQLPAWAKPAHLVFATGAWAAWAALVLHALPAGARHRV